MTPKQVALAIISIALICYGLLSVDRMEFNKMSLLESKVVLLQKQLDSLERLLIDHLNEMKN